MEESLTFSQESIAYIEDYIARHKTYVEKYFADKVYWTGRELLYMSGKIANFLVKCQCVHTLASHLPNGCMQCSCNKFKLPKKVK